MNLYVGCAPITSLPPFEVPEDFAKSVMDSLPEPEEVRSGWFAPLAAAASALVIGLFGFYLFTGATLSDVLLSFNRIVGAATARLLPFLAKALKIAVLLLGVAADAVSMLLAGLEGLPRAQGPPGVARVQWVAGARNGTPHH